MNTGSAATDLTTRLSVSLPEHSRVELAQIAKKKKVSVAWVIREAIEQYLVAQAPLFHQDQR